eukprot:TRINITY_DN10642_c0_g1_i1.p1 TRINITY_DN10642_c0_g1~~TRINITY_DN10642_c0_g1_i1.p1  ORF type:complete len:407 (+),score=55.95 TRINITY_DN10642_c0_g1_i1:136-1356(+)
MAFALRLLISCLAPAAAGSLAAAQPACVEGAQCGGDDSILLQLSGPEPPPCYGKECGEACYTRQNKLGRCNLASQCDTSGRTTCTTGDGAQDQQGTKPLYCFARQNNSCYSKGWPSCCIEKIPCTTLDKPACDLPRFHLANIGSCQPPAKFIQSKSQCEAAGHSIAPGEPVRDAGLPVNPFGCYYKAENPPGSRLWFNPNGGRNNQDPVRLSICEFGDEILADPECENRACGVACKKGACSANGKCLELSDAPQLGCETEKNYMLISIQEYAVDSRADTDDNWFDDADVFVEVVCGDTRYKSKVFQNQNEGNVGLHFFAHRSASSDSCTLGLHDDDGGKHETILTGTISLARSPVDSHMEIEKQTCYFGLCNTFTGAGVKYSIVDGSSARERLSSGAKLTPGVQAE